ncbi:hypothetical protein K1X84_14210 [bacterium]|nr:hypothetical protein [bacterium]
MIADFDKTMYDAFRKTIHDFCGIYLADDAYGEFTQKVRDRMLQLGLDNDYARYHNMLGSRSDNDELRKLVELITNNETYFFREPSHFRILKMQLIPEILKHKREKKIKIWSAGCSSGEEAYSIAITLHEARLIYGDFDAQVIATDIDRAALSYGRKGHYNKNAFRSVDVYYLNSYFRNPGVADKTYRIIDERIRKMVLFEYVNLFQEDYGELIRDFDIIFFRNVSIYFSKDKIREINKRLAHTLAENGFLFVSSSETLHHNFGHLKLVEKDGVFLYQLKPSTPATDTQPIATKTIEALIKQPARKFQAQVSEVPIEIKPVQFEQIFKMFKNGNYDEALSHLEDNLRHAGQTIPLLALKAHILIGKEYFDKATDVCRQMIATDPVEAESYFLLGLIHMYQHELARAEEHFRKAIFLKNDFSLAHFHLASVLWNTGYKDDARREYRNAVRILENRADASLSFIALAYSSEYLINACKQYLK